MTRRFFGTDGVRGVVGEGLTPELIERLGKAATLWSRGGRVFVGRDTRASGPELEEAFARGIVEAGGNAVLAGVLPTPAVALLALDLGVVVSASHNPPEYNGIKVFDRDGRKLSDAAEEEIEALLDAEGPGEGKIDRVDILSFDEPTDYFPKRRWLDQFLGRKLDDDLSLNRAIRPMSGASLTGRAIVNASRKILSIHNAIK